VADHTTDTSKKDRKSVSTQKMATFNSFHDVACLKLKLLYNLTTGCFQDYPLFGVNTITLSDERTLQFAR